ncbi:MAG: hypothetical protein JNL83_02870 [Myxococcales bacterium]|nr:hypothetical protein [Myxococcales bacterium]
MPEVVYLSCALTSTFCAVLQVRSYKRQRTGLLLWSSACFTGLALNNVLLFVDLVVVPDVDMSTLRSASALVAIVMLLVGLVWESR